MEKKENRMNEYLKVGVILAIVLIFIGWAYSTNFGQMRGTIDSFVKSVSGK